MTVSSSWNESFSRLLHLIYLMKGKGNAHDLSLIMFFIIFHLEALFISPDKFIVLVTLHVILDILIESRIMEWFILWFQEPQNGSWNWNLDSIPWPWAGSASTGSGCSKLHITRPWMLPGMGHPQLLWATSASYPHNTEFLSNLNLSAPSLKPFPLVFSVHALVKRPPPSLL